MNKVDVTVAGKDGRSRRWEEHRRARRLELSAAALRTIRRKGPHVGMDEIAETAGTSKTVYYRHFRDRAGLWSAVVDRTVEFIYSHMSIENLEDVPLLELMNELADSYLTLVEQDPEIYEFVTTGPGQPGTATGLPEPLAGLTGRIGAELSEHLRHRGLGEQSEVWAQAMVGAIWAAADHWVTTDRAAPKDVVVEQLHNLFRPGLEHATGVGPHPPLVASHPKEHIMTSTITTPDATVSPLGAQLRAALDGQFHEFKEHLRRALDPEVVVRPHDQSMEEAREWTLASLKALGPSGYNRVGMPEELGGTHDQAHSIAAFEVLATGDLSLTIKAGVQSGLFGGAILNLGNEEQRATWLPAVMSMELLGCYAMTELGRGSDVQSLETTITWVPETKEFDVHTPNESATKAYIGNAARHGEMAAVFGQLIVGGENHGVHCIIVPVRDGQGEPMPGVTLRDHGLKGGLLGVDNGMMAFNHVRVPRTNLLNRYGDVSEEGVYSSPIERRGERFSTMLSTLVRGRISVGGAAASATRRGLIIATRHAMVREQFKKPTNEPVTIIEYQTHQKKLIPEIARAYAFGFAQNELIRQYDARIAAQHSGEVEKDVVRELETRAAGMKVLQTRWANDTLQVCREACGGYGYMAENGLTTLRQDADVFATFEGDNTVLQLLLADFKANWSNLNLLEAARKSSALVGNRILERTTGKATIDRLVSIASAKRGAAKLRARGWHVEMLEYRERRISESLGMRMRDVLKLDKEDQFEGLNQCQIHMVHAADAHMERVVLEAFIEGISSVAEGPARSLLIKLCDLYALATIEKHAVWYLERSALDGSRSHDVSLEIEKLSAELVEDLPDILDGLGVNEEFLNSALVQRRV